jgi:hypothetical protein
VISNLNNNVVDRMTKPRSDNGMTRLVSRMDKIEHISLGSRSLSINCVTNNIVN